MLSLFLEIFVCVFFGENVLDGLKINITQVVLPELLEVLSGVSELIIINVFVDLLNSDCQPAQDPLVDEGIPLSRDLRVIFHVWGESSQSEFDGLPDFVTELSVTDDSQNIQVDVHGSLHVGQKSEPQGIRSTFRNTLREISFLLLDGSLNFSSWKVTLEDLLLEVFEGGTINDLKWIDNVS